jgi:hypothetical protein
MLKPFQIVWELLEFGLQALFVYVLAIILCIGLIAGVIYNKKQDEPVIVYEDPIQSMIIPDEPPEALPAKHIPELVCTRIEGCETFKDAKTPEEYCPNCEWR